MQHTHSRPPQFHHREAQEKRNRVKIGQEGGAQKFAPPVCLFKSVSLPCHQYEFWNIRYDKMPVPFTSLHRGRPVRRRKGRDPMQLAHEVRSFSSACEHILFAFAQHRQLTPGEAIMIQYYCSEILGKVEPLVPKET